jgi:hypothetical protein
LFFGRSDSPCRSPLPKRHSRNLLMAARNPALTLPIVFVAEGRGPRSSPLPNSDTNRDKHQLNMGPESAMRWHTSSASSSSADIVADLFRLIPPNERTAFREMLEHELRGRELPGCELRRVAERAWHRFLRYGWPKHGPGDVA